ncbi:MAG: hypothetical protein KGO82_14365 [Bacteroidota bacterium]|nr:hypothetical protein [Bacteroidota bacterium]
MKTFFKFLLLAILPTVVSLIAIVIVASSKQPEVVHIAAGTIKGYKNAPEQWQVTASPRLRWDSHSKVTVWIGLVVFLIGAAIGYLFEVAKKDKGTGRGFVFGSWAAGLLLIFGSYSGNYYSSHWTKQLDTSTYEANKADLDNLFK